MKMKAERDEEVASRLSSRRGKRLKNGKKRISGSRKGKIQVRGKRLEKRGCDL